MNSADKEAIKRIYSANNVFGALYKFMRDSMDRFSGEGLERMHDILWVMYCIAAPEPIRSMVINEQTRRNTPKKTYASVFLKMHPDADISKICVKDIYGETGQACIGHDFFTECWNREMKN